MQIDAIRALRSYDQLKLIARTSDPGLGWCNGPAGWNADMIWYNYISTQIWGWNHSSRYLKMYLYQDVGCLILKGVRSVVASRELFINSHSLRKFNQNVWRPVVFWPSFATNYVCPFGWVTPLKTSGRECVNCHGKNRTNQRSEVKSICSIRKILSVSPTSP